MGYGASWRSVSYRGRGMKLLAVSATALLFLLSTVALARRGGHSGGSVHVSGYMRANGTYVHDYHRSAPGTAEHSYGSSSSSVGGLSDAYEGVESNKSDQARLSASMVAAQQPSEPQYEFKAVMNDEEIAKCK